MVADHHICLFEAVYSCPFCWWCPTNHFCTLPRWPTTPPFSAKQCTSPYCSSNYRLLQEAGFNALQWSPRSPDLNPRENVWDSIWKRLVTLHHPPKILVQLIKELQLAWNEVPPVVVSTISSSNTFLLDVTLLISPSIYFLKKIDFVFSTIQITQQNMS